MLEGQSNIFEALVWQQPDSTLFSMRAKFAIQAKPISIFFIIVLNYIAGIRIAPNKHEKLCKG